MKKTKLLGMLTSAVMLITSASPAFASAGTASSSSSDMRNITTMELVRDMGIGINLGNTYESCGDWIAQWGDGTPESYETAWGSPIITEDIIQGYADAGFEVLRVPVAWSNLMGEDYTISPEYLEAVREAVDWALKCDMYVILNIHYDGGWWTNFPTNKEECMYKYTRIWTQLCDAFQDYSDYLMFESLNEEGCWDSVWNQWGGTAAQKKTAFGLLNEINQTFVDIVRSSGGNNPKRHLLIAGYATNISLTCDDLFLMPEDPANRCAVSVHYYTPATFAILEEDADWGTARTTWGTDADFKELNSEMDKMKTTFIDNGIPVILGEYGCPKKNKEIESVRLFISSVCEAAYDRQICPVLWDITGLHYNRDTCEMTDPELLSMLMSIPEKSDDEIKLGDVNRDGAVDSSDASRVLSEYALIATGGKSMLTYKQISAADINADNAIDSSDASTILAYYAFTSTGGTGSLEDFMK